jgi:hypothetical protein
VGCSCIGYRCPKTSVQTTEKLLGHRVRGQHPLPRQTMHMIDILLNMLKCNTKSSNSWRGDFTGGKTRKARNSRNQEVQSVDHRRNRISSEISQFSQNRSSYTTMDACKAPRESRHVQSRGVYTLLS